MAETRTSFAIADYDQCSETEALTTLNGLADPVDMDELFNQFFALLLVAATTIIAPTTRTSPSRIPSTFSHFARLAMLASWVRPDRISSPMMTRAAVQIRSFTVSCLLPRRCAARIFDIALLYADL